eukprot:s165_g16.t1
MARICYQRLDAAYAEDMELGPGTAMTAMPLRTRRLALPGKRRLVLSAVAAVMAVATLSGLRLPEAAAQPGKFALRVCEKCVSRKAGSGYNPKFVLDQTSKAAAAAGWPAPGIEWGKCTGGCDYGPTVRLVKGEYVGVSLHESRNCASSTSQKHADKAIPVVVRLKECPKTKSTSRPFWKSRANRMLRGPSALPAATLPCKHRAPTPTSRRQKCLPRGHAGSGADTNYGSKSSGTEAEQSVFESQPKQSSAEVSHASASTPADAAQSTFESQPSQSKADTAYAAAAASASEPSAFESNPQQSKAAVGYGRADAPSAGEVQSVFESQPQKSKAMVTAADKDCMTAETGIALLLLAPPAAGDGQSVFESKPAESKAETSYSKAASAADQSQSVFESQPKQSSAMVSHNDKTSAQGTDQSVFESQPAQSKAEIGYGRNAAASDQEQSVFESKPAESKAHYKAGAAVDDEESEYETDEEG